MRIWFVPAALGLAVFAADQLSKGWIQATLGPEPRVKALPLAGDWLALVYSRNTGVAFGLFQNMPQFFTMTSLVITAGALYAYATYLPKYSPWVQAAIGLIVGGAVGNIVDRLRMGSVVDFISIGWWPVFNLADSAIAVGVTLLAAYLIFIGDEPAPAPLPDPRDDGLLTDLLNQDVD
jgi:signal peptidase II